MKDKLCESIQINLEAQGISLSIKEIRNLYIATLSGIYDLTEEGEVVDISDFGSFWKKKADNASVRLFTPSDRLNDIVNKQDE